MLMFPYDCIDALDDTYIQAIVGGPDVEVFRSHRGHKAWNVLVVCSFDTILVIKRKP